MINMFEFCFPPFVWFHEEVLYGRVLVVFSTVYVGCECVIRCAYIDVILCSGWIVLIGFVAFCGDKHCFIDPP